ncbi:MAG: DUF4339 domain-containing protein [Verrucomicrobiales bacterium]|nr:DUF4339 domain-containing protein [Verrucomicrobiales bacterium]
MNYYVSIDSQVYGPYPAVQILSMRENGTVNSETLAVPEGQENWQPLSAFFPEEAPPVRPVANPSISGMLDFPPSATASTQPSRQGFSPHPRKFSPRLIKVRRPVATTRKHSISASPARPGFWKQARPYLITLLILLLLCPLLLFLAIGLGNTEGQNLNSASAIAMIASGLVFILVLILSMLLFQAIFLHLTTIILAIETAHIGRAFVTVIVFIVISLGFTALSYLFATPSEFDRATAGGPTTTLEIISWIVMIGNFLLQSSALAGIYRIGFGKALLSNLMASVVTIGFLIVCFLLSFLPAAIANT